jgi:hypothetical protein
MAVATGTAILGAAALGTAGMLGSQAMANKKSGGGYEGGGVVTMPQYQFTEPRLQLTSDFYTQQIQNLMAGEAPPYLQQYLPKMKKYLQTGLDESYLGRSGERRGGVELAREAGLSSGLGPKAAVSGTQKVLRDYMDKSEAIDQYISGLEFSAVQDASKTFPYYSQMMPTGPNAQVVPAQQIPETPNYYGQSMSNMAGNIPWEMLLNASSGTPSTPSYLTNPYNSSTPQGYSPSTWSSLQSSYPNLFR